MEQKTIRGEKIVYEKIAGLEEICIGCAMNYNGHCLVWKYISSPELCKEFKEEINTRPISGYSSPPLIEIGVHKILVYWDWKTKKTEYAYRKVKSITDINGYRVVGIRKATEGEYLAFCEKERKDEEQRRNRLIKYFPSHNPWI